MKRRPRPDLSQVALVDWARLAAYIDGEGHIALNTNKQRNGTAYAYLRVVVTNTDPRLIVWLQRTFGGAVLRAKPYRPNWNPCFKWTATCRHAVAVLEGCLPYFVMKREQAELGLAYQATMRYHRWRRASEEVEHLRQQFRDQLLALRVPRESTIERDADGEAVEVAIH